MRAEKLPTWAPAAGVALALAALVTWSFAQRYAQLTETPFPVGIDGYFYPLELRSLLATGHLQYPASPLTFWLLAPLAAITDPITGAKLGAALFGAVIALPAYGVGARLGKSRAAGVLAAVIATTSAGSAFMTFEFVKNGVGLTIGMTAVWLLLRMLERPSRGRIFAFGVAFLAAFLAHKMAAAIVLVIAIPAGVAEAASRGVLRGRRLLYTLIYLGIGAGVLLLLGVMFPEQFLSPLQAALVTASLSTSVHWDAPALVMGDGSLTLGHEALLGAACAILAALVLHRRARLRLGLTVTAPSAGEAAAGWAFVCLALVIALPWLAVTDGQGLGFRMRVAAFVPFAMCAAIGLRVVVWGVRTLLLAGKPWAPLEPVLGIGLAAVLVIALPHERTAGRIVTHPALVTATLALADKVPADDTVIIPERHIAYMAAWYANVRVSLRPDPIAPAHRWRLMPLAYIGDRSPLDQALLAARAQPGLAPPIGLHPLHPDGLVLVPEKTWAWVLGRLPPRDREHYAAWPTY